MVKPSSSSCETWRRSTHNKINYGELENCDCCPVGGREIAWGKAKQAKLSR
jgi:hypothetical protein